MQPSSSYSDGESDEGRRDGILLPGYDDGGGEVDNHNDTSNLNNNSRSSRSSPRSRNLISPFGIDNKFSIDGGEDDDGDELRDYNHYVYDHEHDVESSNDDHNQSQGLLGRTGNNYPSSSSNPPLHEDDARRQQQRPPRPGNSNNTNKIPPNYICPLTLKLMSDPMNDNCGHTFDRQAIFDWIDYTTAKNERRNRRRFLGYSLAGTATGQGGACSVCPISRRPMDKDDLFHNGRLKAQIEEWKDRHGHFDGYDYEHEDEVGGSGGGAASPFNNSHNKNYISNKNVNVKPDMSLLDIENEHHSYSQFELMLLPQERSVLNVVKMRARTRQERQKFSKCMWCIGISLTVVVVAAVIVALKFFNVRLSGPL